ncbi:hypothetical protein [Sciscionella marina]|uniref:hypothetical protein n=1 Tax=Sciscionella marina TaxID=508770 RepID=UPI00036CBF60|nr:hypothetical protein [Sciscionella marina]
MGIVLSRPARLIGGVALLIAPLVWFTGLLLRYLVPYAAGFGDARLAWFDRQTFAFPKELAAYAADPGFVVAAFAVFALAALLLMPAVNALGRPIASRSGWVAWFAVLGVAMMMFSFAARFYRAGVDHTAFMLVRAQGLDAATNTIAQHYVDISYGPWNLATLAHFLQYPGALLLGLAAWNTGILGTARVLLWFYTWTIWGGVLKESEVADLVGAGTLCVVLIPLGVRFLRDRVPVAGSRSSWLSW